MARTVKLQLGLAVIAIGILTYTLFYDHDEVGSALRSEGLPESGYPESVGQPRTSELADLSRSAEAPDGRKPKEDDPRPVELLSSVDTLGSSDHDTAVKAGLNAIARLEPYSISRWQTVILNIDDLLHFDSAGRVIGAADIVTISPFEDVNMVAEMAEIADYGNHIYALQGRLIDGGEGTLSIYVAPSDAESDFLRLRINIHTKAKDYAIISSRVMPYYVAVEVDRNYPWRVD